MKRLKSWKGIKKERIIKERVMGLQFFNWFYIIIPQRILSYFKVYFLNLMDLFSVKICFKTFFAPWKRDILSTRGVPLKKRFEIWGMNLISRFIGAVIKLFTLFTFLLSVFLWLAVFLVYFFGWLFFPLIFFVSIFTNYPGYLIKLLYG